jgi:hypothetical protein
MIQRFLACPGGVDEYLEIILDPMLPDVLIEASGAQRSVTPDVLFPVLAAHHSWCCGGVWRRHKCSDAGD